MNEIGLIGLGVMGANLILNIYDNYSKLISGFDIDQNKVNEFKSQLNTENKNEIKLFNKLEEFVNSLKAPRRIIILIPAGKYVDMLLDKLLPLLGNDDNLLDGGNEWYKNTESRQNNSIVLAKNIKYLGCGISGGEKGARYGPCMMAGGSKLAFDSFKEVLENICVRYNNDVCVDYFGNGGIGNYVKMVHNGIEYGLMQVISETYIMFKSFNYSNQEISNIFSEWNENKLKSYLLEISVKILNKKDDSSDIDLIDLIKEEVESKGTGYMTVVDALEKKIPINIIFSALEFRNTSFFRKNINIENKIEFKINTKGKEIIQQIENALYLSFILVFVQGINLIYQHYYLVEESKLDIVKLLKVWRNGCIIKCDLLNEFIDFMSSSQDDINKLYKFVESKNIYLDDLENICKLNNLPIITLSNCLQYYNLIFSETLKSGKLLQAMRDCFGGHMYERTDKDGKFHSEWL